MSSFLLQCTGALGGNYDFCHGGPTFSAFEEIGRSETLVTVRCGRTC